MADPSPFKLSSTPSANYADTESLFRDLKNRDPKIQHLWSHQADILRDYQKVVERADVALELPTGSGKTLVGLLIAEWRRIALQQRVAYLCPTRQLAHQVGLKATEYGIKAYVLVGSQSQYPAGKFSEYASSAAIAITTYSGLFNSNPKIDRPETIILDDAHAGENYIAKMWSLPISRTESPVLYHQVLDLFAEALPDYLVSSLKDENATSFQRQSVELLPGPLFFEKHRALSDLLEASTQNTELIYSWTLLRAHLGGCCAFFSWGEILIRPWIPPSHSHLPFASAKQRVYMSATLGAGGDLERITGCPSISRIPVPAGWDRQSTGRRFFIFPNHSFSESEYEEWLIELLNTAERALVLTPHATALRGFIEAGETYGLKHNILTATHIEESLQPFTDSSGVILGLTNRYDGLDLPGDNCRHLVVFGLPAAVNLQERFLWSRLSLTNVLTDRIRTRITQAVGRCTRNSTDYAVVIMIGENLFDFLVKRENRAELHPELRAEMDFGMDNSAQDKIQKLSEMIQIFLSRDSRWTGAEIDITKRREDTSAHIPDYVPVFRDIVRLEVAFCNDMWREDYGGALVKATSILDKLSGDQFSGYRALWNYFAGCAAQHLGTVTHDPVLISTASERFTRASQAARNISWFARLAHQLGTPSSPEAKPQYLEVLSAERINESLTRLGAVGTRFDRTMNDNAQLISSDEADKFDRGLTELGKLLGFNAEKPGGDGLPDSVWRLASENTLLFESKADETPADKISIRTCRQAQGHLDWERARPFFSQNAKMHCIVVSPRTIIEDSARPHAKGLRYYNVTAIRSLYKEVESCLRVVRSKSPDLSAEDRIRLIREEYTRCGLTPPEIINRLTETTLLSLPSK